MNKDRIKNSIIAMLAIVCLGQLAWSQFVGIETRGTYRYKSSLLSVTGTVQLTGIGTSWVVEARGGNVTFNINGGDSIALLSGRAIDDKFTFFSGNNPSINVTALDPGASALVIISGGGQ